MPLGILGRKLGMTQIFDSEGKVVPVTILEAGPCVVVQKKDINKDGYKAIQVGFGEVKPKKVNKPMEGHFKKAGVKPFKWLKEFKVDNVAEFEIGAEIKVDIFEPGEKVDVIGISKGKGTAGVMKKYGFSGGPASHGASKFHRKGSSIGASSFPGRVFKGKRMAGHMGLNRVTVKNLQVVDVDVQNNLLLIKGAVPGAKNSLVIVRKKA